MGIFEVVCPSCGEINSVDARACACGNIFSAVTGSYEATQLSMQEEEAYLEYVKARLAQLKSEKEFAKSAVTANPGNRNKEHALELIRQEIAELKAQYSEQKAKIKIIQKVNEDLREQMEQEAAETRARAEAEVMRLKTEQEKTEKLKKMKQAADEERARKKAEAELAGKNAEAAAKKQAALKQQAAEKTAKEAQLLAEQKANQRLGKQKLEEASKMMAEAQRIGREAAAATATADQIALRATKAKADKKNKSMPNAGAFNKAQQMAKIARPEPVLDANAGLADAAEEIQQPTTLECPNCTADLPLDATECRCGYKFQKSASDMPSLSTGDFFAPVVPEGKQEMQQCPICTAEVPANATTCNCGYKFPSGESDMPGLSLDGRTDG